MGISQLQLVVYSHFESCQVLASSKKPDRPTHLQIPQILNQIGKLLTRNASSRTETIAPIVRSSAHLAENYTACCDRG